MKYSSTLLLFAVLVSHAHTAPQLISFQDGKLGVSFGGYHAGIGIGGLLGNGTRGGLFAEAGTPTGQFATAGLGGSVGPHGISSGGLFAGATAGGNYHASAGLSGSTNTGNAIGSGFATAQGGNRITSSILGGLTGDKGSTGFTYSGAKEVEVVPLKSSINTELNVESVNEVQPIEKSQVEITKTVIKEETPPAVLVKEVHVEPQPQAVETHVVHTHYKPRRAHFRKTAFLGGYVGGQGEIVGPDPNPVVKTESEAERRVDVGVEAHAGAAADANVNGGVRKVYTKEVSVQRNPTFFRDIFDIPISTLKAVGNFLGNTASRTNISVQKSVHAESEPKHDSSLSSSSSAHISVETPSASSFIDDILSIPINTLGAVNRFLENNVGRKSVQVVHEEGAPASRVRRVPHARRRLNKRVIVEEDSTQ